VNYPVDSDCNRTRAKEPREARLAHGVAKGTIFKYTLDALTDVGGVEWIDEKCGIANHFRNRGFPKLILYAAVQHLI